MIVKFSPLFLKKLKKLEKDLQDDVIQQVEIFKKNPQTPALKTHKLKGRLQGIHRFSVNYQYRILFEYISAKEVSFLTIGNHDVYKI